MTKGDELKSLTVEQLVAAFEAASIVEEQYQGNGIGKALVIHAFGRTVEVAEHVGVYALTLEAINQEKADTYKRWNFEYFVEGELWNIIH
jgi:GNAT superfamily N-acetyltransferase